MGYILHWYEGDYGDHDYEDNQLNNNNHNSNNSPVKTLDSLPKTHMDVFITPLSMCATKFETQLVDRSTVDDTTLNNYNHNNSNNSPVQTLDSLPKTHMDVFITSFSVCATKCETQVFDRSSVDAATWNNKA